MASEVSAGTVQEIEKAVSDYRAYLFENATKHGLNADVEHITFFRDNRVTGYKRNVGSVHQVPRYDN